MRIWQHVKEGKLVPMYKDGEKFFLKVFEKEGGFVADLWVFDTYPGERRRGIPVRLNYLGWSAPTIRELLEHYKSMGFRILHPYHKEPKWIAETSLESRINGFYLGR